MGGALVVVVVVVAVAGVVVVVAAADVVEIIGACVGAASPVNGGSNVVVSNGSYCSNSE